MDPWDRVRPDPGRLPRAKDVEAYLDVFLEGFHGYNHQRFYSFPVPTLGIQNLEDYLVGNLENPPDFRFSRPDLSAITRLVQVYVAVEKQ